MGWQLKVEEREVYLSYLSITLYLSLFYFRPPSHLPLARLMILSFSHYTYLSSALDHPPTCHWPGSSPIVTHSPLDSYITSYPFVLGSLIALMMEAARTSEMSVDIDLRTRQYLPEDSELNTENATLTDLLQ
jgi:hypothetical protein